MNFELLVFTADPHRAKLVIDAGADAVIIDWENRCKHRRQAGADTEINADTPDDLRRVRQAISAPIICRINGPGPTVHTEVETAIAGGADEILLPMVCRHEEALQFLDAVNGRCRAGILIETPQAVALAPQLGTLPLHRIYVGLNDLAIARRSPNIFKALTDGTVDSIRPHVQSRFGVAGLTRPDAGNPIPCSLLIGELLRIQTSFSFLRRSFWRDTVGRDLPTALSHIRQALHHASRRTPEQIHQDRDQFQQSVNSLLSSAA
ncbi:MAG: aldolase/citrate lyase family protein [Acidobacteria bacterium]|nr:aldolase/citrate lyase family protein [Acidobacteriota bacterium]